MPWPASEANYLDRALVAFDIENFECQNLGGEELETQSGATVLLNSKYYTFSTPYLCWCNPSDPEQAWCVADSFPRPFRQLSERNDSGALWEPQDFQNAKIHTAYCSSRDPLNKMSSTVTP